ncbi:MAG: glycosyltransferase family 87 protein [Smithella sp.]|nr:glycosyltransferase family 87 protein [Smithella sp.]
MNILPSEMQTSSRNKIQILCLVAIILFLILFIKTSHDEWPFIKLGKDFTAYWASAYLLTEGQNPYRTDLIFSREMSVGWPDKNPLVMYNPPWVLSYILPFTLGNYVSGKFLWLLTVFVCTLICFIWLWQFYGGTDKGRGWGIVILFSYMPFYFCMAKGQIVPLILLGIVGFLHFERKEQWFLAGLSACLLTIKPQDTYLFLIAFIFWSIYEKHWKTLSGAGCAFLFTVAVPTLNNPHIYFQYYTEVLSRSVQHTWETPTLGYWLRSLLGKEKLYLQYLPTIAGTAWFVYHWFHHRKKWIWAKQAPILIFMSLLTTLYAWVNDYVLLLVAIIQAGVWLVNNPFRPYSIFMIILYIIINVMAWITAFTAQSEKWIVWIVLALLINYVLVKFFLLKQMKVVTNS